MLRGRHSSIVQSNSASEAPTSQAYQDLQFAFDYFNDRLFEGRLPHCLLTLTRKRRALGYFAPERFTNTGGRIAHEISLNPRYLELQGDYDALSTLVHEQCHAARHDAPPNRNGGRGTRGYHDRAWGKIMRSLGLVPSDTGRPGGRQTGYRMSHYVEDGGRFDIVCRELLVGGFTLRWRDKVQTIVSRGPRGALPVKAPDSPAQTRTKFTCTECGLNAWAKPRGTAGLRRLLHPNVAGQRLRRK